MLNNVKTDENQSGDRRFVFISFGFLFLVIILSTYLHQLQPQIMGVPSNSDVSSWTMPTFEQTFVYNRMNETERQRVLSEGVPGTDLVTLIWYELLSIIGGWLCFLHARKYFGVIMASCFLIGSFIFTGLQESIMIFSGRYWMGGGRIDPTVFGSYWFPQHLFSFVEAPVWVCICWFIIAYSCVWTAGKLFPRLSLTKRALIGALIAVVIDLWEDPVLTSPELMKWVWAKGDHIVILGIPHGNFNGWFFLIFVFAILWEKFLPCFIEKWGVVMGGFSFLGMILCSNFLVLAALLGWGTITNMIFSNGLYIPPQSWGW